MSKSYDENSCVRTLTNKCRLVIDGRKVIKAAKDQVIGIKAWGKIDYLVNYRGYIFMRDNRIIQKPTTPQEKQEIKKTKKVIRKVRKDIDTKPIKKR